MRAQLNQIIADLTALRDTLPDDPDSNAKMSAQSIQLAIRKHAFISQGQPSGSRVVFEGFPSGPRVVWEDWPSGPDHISAKKEQA